MATGFFDCEKLMNPILLYFSGFKPDSGVPITRCGKIVDHQIKRRRGIFGYAFFALPQNEVRAAAQFEYRDTVVRQHHVAHAQ